MILGILMSNEVKIAVLESQVERLLEKQKELTERVRANEKVVAAIGLFGSVAVAFIGAGYFAPSAEACSPRLDGEPTYCPDWDDVVLRDPPVQEKEEEEEDPYTHRVRLYDTRYDVAHIGHSFPTGEWIEKIRNHEAKQERMSVEDMLNNTLMEYEYGSDGSTESQELLQLSSDGDQQSIRWRHDRRDDRSWFRSLQEGESESSRGGHTREEDS